MPFDQAPLEESLDPQDWEAFRHLAHRMLDDMLDYQKDVRQRPVWQPVPAEVKDFLKRPLPLEPQTQAGVYQDFVENVLPYPMGNIHPRFWGWVMGNGTPFAVMAELLAATMNPNMGGGDHGANYVEVQVLDWLKEMFHYPAEASGLLVSQGEVVSAQDSAEDSAVLLFATNNFPTFVPTNWPARSTDGVYTAVAGLYAILADGVNLGYRYLGLGGSVHGLEPRTAMGISRSSRPRRTLAPWRSARSATGFSARAAASRTRPAMRVWKA